MAERVYATVGVRDLGRILEYVPQERAVGRGRRHPEEKRPASRRAMRPSVDSRELEACGETKWVHVGTVPTQYPAERGGRDRDGHATATRSSLVS